MSENVKQPWDATKWWMLIAILMIIEGFVFYAALENSNSLSALGYVSFAGTITSIILAVLAIIYGFVQSGSHERKSEFVSEQMGRVKEVVDELRASKSALGGDLTSLSNLAQKIETLTESFDFHSQKTSHHLEKLEKLNSNTQNSLQTLFLSNEEGGNNSSKLHRFKNEYLLALMEQNPYVLKVVMGLFFAGVKKIGAGDAYRLIAKHFWDTVDKEKKVGINFDEFDSYYYGTFDLMLMILKDIGGLEINAGLIELSDNSTFLEDELNRIKGTSQDKYIYTKKLIRTIEEYDPSNSPS
ncbi:hypothetical protein [Hydrogenovibrio sp. JE_KL2]|uniref:hypothetical protein n=1 Tax=Hydrogenovibrio sp. JE_KL2 TaxID=2651188 RepID=UPI00128D874B|nr:hypothetical protein [Hydrogenovibrio sp. JE_KL2]MPQ76950.1 hypothetical protein [Hydrogenovibrio sp. JE_KL2]